MCVCMCVYTGAYIYTHTHICVYIFQMLIVVSGFFDFISRVNSGKLRVSLSYSDEFT